MPLSFLRERKLHRQQSHSWIGSETITLLTSLYGIMLVTVSTADMDGEEEDRIPDTF